jgi:RNA polymerase sigma-70 factor (ECF subfamily)
VSLSAFAPVEVNAHEDGVAQLPDPDLGAAGQVMRRELDEGLRQSIERLSAAHRAVVLMRFFEDAALPEIAVALGIPLGTVKSRLHHALNALGQMPEVMNLLVEREDLRS